MRLDTKLNEFLEQAKNKVKNMAGQSDAPHMKMKVCMLGARGVGKTSVITSMYNNHKDAVDGTKLFLIADGDTRYILDNKREELKNIFSGIHREGELVRESGIPGDASESVFTFTYGMGSEKICMDLEIRDYPGEYLRSEPEVVADFVREASAVMIVIDTPCMMEAEGRYHLAKNRPDLVSEFLMEYLGNEEEKLILFVPLKCEKYCREGKIDEVSARVRKEYKELIEYLRDRENLHGFKKKICCAVTPIQTLGTVVFDSFAVDANTGQVREIATGDGKKLPAETRYHYAANNAAYAPLNCVQPLYYLLAFVSKQYEKARKEQKSTGWLARLLDSLRLLPNVEGFLLEIQGMGMKRIENAQGYKVLFGHGRI